jgi:predicted nucleic acid-binding protein
MQGQDAAWLIYEQLLNESVKFLTSNWVAYRDKKWGIVDYSSILLMKKKKCSLVFGYDHHFIEASRQYGFTLL